MAYRSEWYKAYYAKNKKRILEAARRRRDKASGLEAPQEQEEKNTEEIK